MGESSDDAFSTRVGRATEQPAFRVKDIQAGPPGSQPRSLTNVRGALYFAANDGSSGVELWRSDGTEAGTRMVKDIASDSSSSVPSSLTAMNGVLYFAANDGSSGDELWKSDGTETGTTQVRDIHLTGSAAPSNLTAAETKLYFTATDETAGTELWRSDGTSSGTVRVRNIGPGATGSSTDELAFVGGKLFFNASDGSTVGNELWMVDDTGGARLVRDIAATASTDSYPSGFTDLGGTVYFRADDGTHGVELWRTNGTQAGTRMVKDIHLNQGDAAPGGLTVVGGALYFTATDGVSGFELWKSDGTEAGTVRIKDIRPGTDSSFPDSLTAVGGTLYFTADDGASGRELWKSDGTEAGTVRVKDIQPGSTGSMRTLANMLAIEPQGVLLFAADDGTSGMELWKSDGTEAGTKRVMDISPGASASSPGSLTLAGTQVFFTADDGTSGVELWAVRVGDLVEDHTAPTIRCPPDQVAEATSADGARVSYPAATASDAVTRSPVLGYTHDRGSLFPLATTQVTATATDEAGNSATCTFAVTVKDTTAPTLQCPESVTVQAEGKDGARVSFTAPTAGDSVDSSPKVSLSAQSGSLFAPGTTEVKATATDASGNVATCAFNVTVKSSTSGNGNPPPDEGSGDKGSGGGCSAGGAAAGAPWGALVLAALSLRRRSRRRAQD
ncbi:HYR domain-containing protein [Pyxidicoccus parkwayensis]|uniref:HYR domain-containing protein n=1 Tax=Pyxidicoccus parkwayensis TaxID=2813578 RepID=A0ABX7P5D9_9BACT|nr:ELWxxDGT repeat protein [Pyxidicoccus parkwaysis]QSQ25700.1 HYR domain-containing protein [Pyxidicoccus parkwaysis]